MDEFELDYDEETEEGEEYEDGELEKEVEEEELGGEELGEEVEEDEEDEEDEDEDEDEEEEDLFALDDEEEEEEEEEDEDGEDEEDGDGEDDEDDEDDDAIYENLPLTEGFQKLVKKATSAGEKIDKGFVIKALENSVDMSFLVENGIYNFNGFVDIIEKYQSINGENPDVVLYPDENDPEGMAEFDETHRNIPQTSDGYDDIFEGIDIGEGPMTEDDKIMEQFKDWYHSQGYSVEQARADLESRQEEVEKFLESSRLEMAEYKQTNAGILRDALGSDYSRAMARIKGVLKQHGQEFAEEFKGTKVLSSAKFYLLLERMMQERYIIPEAEEVAQETTKRDYTKLKDTQLVALREKIAASEHYTEEKQYGTPREQRRWKRLDAQLESIVKEEVRRRG